MNRSLTPDFLHLQLHIIAISRLILHKRSIEWVAALIPCSTDDRDTRCHRRAHKAASYTHAAGLNKESWHVTTC